MSFITTQPELLNAAAADNAANIDTATQSLNDTPSFPTGPQTGGGAC
jgi:hypothetical protein